MFLEKRGCSNLFFLEYGSFFIYLLWVWENNHGLKKIGLPILMITRNYPVIIDCWWQSILLIKVAIWLKELKVVILFFWISLTCENLN